MADFEKRRQLCVDSLISQITSEVERENSSMDGDDRNTDSDSDLIAYQVSVKVNQLKAAWKYFWRKLKAQV